MQEYDLLFKVSVKATHKENRRFVKALARSFSISGGDVWLLAKCSSIYLEGPNCVPLSPGPFLAPRSCFLQC